MWNLGMVEAPLRSRLLDLAVLSRVFLRRRAVHGRRVDRLGGLARQRPLDRRASGCSDSMRPFRHRPLVRAAPRRSGSPLWEPTQQPRAARARPRARPHAVRRQRQLRRSGSRPGARRDTGPCGSPSALCRERGDTADARAPRSGPTGRRPTAGDLTGGRPVPGRHVLGRKVALVGQAARVMLQCANGGRRGAPGRRVADRGAEGADV